MESHGLPEEGAGQCDGDAGTDPPVPFLQVPERYDAAEAGSVVERPGFPAQLLHALLRALCGGAHPKAVSTWSPSHGEGWRKARVPEVAILGQ